MKNVKKLLLIVAWAIVPFGLCYGASILVINNAAYTIHVWSSHLPDHNSHATAVVLAPGEGVQLKDHLKPFRDINWRDPKFHTNFTVDLNIPWWHIKQRVEVFTYGMYRSLYHGTMIKRASVLTSTGTHSLLQHLIVKFLLPCADLYCDE